MSARIKVIRIIVRCKIRCINQYLPRRCEWAGYRFAHPITIRPFESDQGWLPELCVFVRTEAIRHAKSIVFEPPGNLLGTHNLVLKTSATHRTVTQSSAARASAPASWCRQLLAQLHEYHFPQREPESHDFGQLRESLERWRCLHQPLGQ